MSRPNSAPQINLSVGKLIGGSILLLIIWGVVSSIYTVPVDSVAVVTRFGKYVRQADRGFNFKLPSGIEDAQIVPVRRQLKMEFGFGTEGSSNRYQSSVPREQQAEQNMVTGDLNSVLVQWVVLLVPEEPHQVLAEQEDLSLLLVLPLHMQVVVAGAYCVVELRELLDLVVVVPVVLLL